MLNLELISDNLYCITVLYLHLTKVSCMYLTYSFKTVGRYNFKFTYVNSNICRLGIGLKRNIKTAIIYKRPIFKEI